MKVWVTAVTAALLCSDPIPARYSYMQAELFTGQFEPGYIVAVDVASIQLFGDGVKPYSDKVDLCIDHHGSNSGYADAMYLDADAAVAYIADHVAAGPDIEPVPFDDVQQGDWFYSAVSFVYSNEIMRGYQDGSRRFGPDDATSRSQLAQILYNLADAPETDASYTDNYVDCVPGAWYMSAISWATQQGLMSGYDDGTNRFDPDAALTREQLAVVLWRAAGKPSTSESLDNFSDSAQTSPWAVEAMEWAVDYEEDSLPVLDQDGGLRGIVTKAAVLSSMI